MATIKNYDKYLHFLGCLLIVVLIGLVNPILGTLAVIIISRIKELKDKADPANHTYDGWDAAAGMASIPLGLVILEVLSFYEVWQPLITLSQLLVAK